MASDMHFAPAMEDTVRILNDLFSACRNSQERFGKAAKACDDLGLRNRFVGIARERAAFAGELAAHLERLGCAPADSGEWRGVQQVAWRDLRAVTGPRRDAELLEEAQRGEEITLGRYERALTQNLPTAVRPVVDRHRLAVQEGLLELRSVQWLCRAG